MLGPALDATCFPVIQRNNVITQPLLDNDCAHASVHKKRSRLDISSQNPQASWCPAIVQRPSPAPGPERQRHTKPQLDYTLNTCFHMSPARCLVYLEPQKVHTFIGGFILYQNYLLVDADSL
jgi:hypothetical protein